MFLDLKVEDLINNKATKVSYNEVIIYRRDIIQIPKLMRYLEDRRIHIDISMRLDSLIKTQQNEIGLLFYEFYEFLIYYEDKSYLNEQKFRAMFIESEDMNYILEKSKILGNNIENGYDSSVLSTDEFNRLLINWFHSNYRNFKSIVKNIPFTNILYDIDLEQGHFKKIVNTSDFLSKMFSRFVSIQKGSIPFSNSFGSGIKSKLQTKATYFAKKSIVEELEDFVKSLTSIYEEVFTLENIEYRETGSIAVKVEVMITLAINDSEIVSFRIENYKE